MNSQEQETMKVESFGISKLIKLKTKVYEIQKTFKPIEPSSRSILASLKKERRF